MPADPTYDGDRSSSPERAQNKLWWHTFASFEALIAAASVVCEFNIVVDVRKASEVQVKVSV